MNNLSNNLILQAARDGELLIYGHSGAMAYAPTNTLPAFELAAEQGAQEVEPRGIEQQGPLAGAQPREQRRQWCIHRVGVGNQLWRCHAAGG